MEGTLAKAAPREPMNRNALEERALRVLEFAWGTQALDVNCDEYGRLMRFLFPRKFRNERAIAQRIKRLRNRKKGLLNAVA
ncbi:MAG: hypothetical protein ACJ8C4_05835 [Gemmataceae bacterium]